MREKKRVNETKNDRPPTFYMLQCKLYGYLAFLNPVIDLIEVFGKYNAFWSIGWDYSWDFNLCLNTFKSLRDPSLPECIPFTKTLIRSIVDISSVSVATVHKHKNKNINMYGENTEVDLERAATYMKSLILTAFLLSYTCVCSL